MSTLAEVLGSVVGGAVADRTGLDGSFDLELRWSPEFDALSQAEPVGSSDAPSIFTAVREQLGLKLEPGRVPATIVVIDRAERPAEN
jgi:uncharacterized protein (TIGR03435 family)